MQILQPSKVPPRLRTGAPIKYPFGEMELRESFIIDCEPGKRKSMQTSVHSSALSRGVRIETRSVEQGLQVWLVSKTRD